jgi:threonine aldolase
LPIAYVQEATAFAKAKGLARHLDGARLFNAAVAQASTGSARAVLDEARRIAQCFDSVSVCFSKGLGAPVGSALCGSREFIARAKRVRKMAGGAMRQAGVLAAAASYALDHHIERLAQDHVLARRLAEGPAGIDGVLVEPPQTNMVFVDLTGAAREKSAGLITHLAGEGVLATGLYRLRFATHLDVDAAGIDRAIAAMRRYFDQA